MFNFLGKLVLSLLVTNWIYAEVVLLFPQFDAVYTYIEESVRIPTHDEWPAIARSPNAKMLRAELEGVLPSGDESFFSVEVLERWERATQSELFRLVTFDVVPSSQRVAQTHTRRSRSKALFLRTRFEPRPSLMDNFSDELLSF